MKITAILVYEIHAKSLTFIERLCRGRASLATEIRACAAFWNKKVTQRIKTSHI